MEKRQRTVYSREFKLNAVELSNQRGALASVAEELHITRDTLKRWKKEFNSGKMKLTTGVKTRSKEEEELMRLKKELYEIKLERDILKKAVSIFSKSDR